MILIHRFVVHIGSPDHVILGFIALVRMVLIGIHIVSVQLHHASGIVDTLS